MTVISSKEVQPLKKMDWEELMPVKFGPISEESNLCLQVISCTDHKGSSCDTHLLTNIHDKADSAAIVIRQDHAQDMFESLIISLVSSGESHFNIDRNKIIERLKRAR